jgi:hypothetical protein
LECSAEAKAEDAPTQKSNRQGEEKQGESFRSRGR